MASWLRKPETSAGQMIWHSFDRRQKIKLLTSSQTIAQGLLWKCKIKMQMHHVEKLSSVKRALEVLARQCDAGVLWKLDIVSGWKSLPSFFRWSLKKKHCKWQRSLSRWSGAGLFVIIFIEGIARFSWAKRLESLPVDFRCLNCVLR